MRRFNYTPKGSIPKSVGIAIAREIASGDIGAARATFAWYTSRGFLGWTPCEARAIGGACRAVNAAYGANVSLDEFMRPTGRRVA
jgi:hypothetical protein